MLSDRTIVASVASLLLAGTAGCAVVLGLERGELQGADGGVITSDAGAADGDRPARYAAAVLADGPLAYYPFLETVGASVVANRAPPSGGTTSPRERDGTVGAGVTLGVPGGLGSADRAMTAGTAGARVELGWSGIPSGNEPFAIELAIRGGVGVGSGTVLAHRDDGGGAFAGYRLAVEGGDVVFERVAATGERATVRAFGVVGDLWTHLVVSSDGVRMSLLVDGAAADSIRTNVRAPGTGTKLTIGSSGAGDPPFGGSIDEVAIYKEEIAEGEVKAHADAFLR